MVYKDRKITPGMLGASRRSIVDSETEFVNSRGGAFPFRVVSVVDDRAEIDVGKFTCWVDKADLAKMEPIVWYTITGQEEEGEAEEEEVEPKTAEWLKMSTLPEPQKEETTWLREKRWAPHPKNPPLYETDQPIKPQQVFGPGRDVLEKKHMPWLETQPTGYGEAFKPSQTPTRSHQRDAQVWRGKTQEGKVVPFIELEVGDEFAFTQDPSIVYYVAAVSAPLKKTLVKYWSWKGMRQTRYLPWSEYGDATVIKILPMPKKEGTGFSKSMWLRTAQTDRDMILSGYGKYKDSGMSEEEIVEKVAEPLLPIGFGPAYWEWKVRKVLADEGLVKKYGFSKSMWLRVSGFRNDWKSVYSEADLHKSLRNKDDLIYLISKYIVSADDDLYKRGELAHLQTKQLYHVWMRNKPFDFGKEVREI